MHRRAFVASIAASPFLVGCAQAQTLAVSVLPIAFDGEGRPVVQISINGRGPFPFVVDTAAQATGLSASVIRDAALAPNGQRAQLHGASGAIEVDLFTLERVQVGPLVREQVIALPLQHAQSVDHDHAGVLGVPLFTDSRVGFHYADRRLEIDRRADRPPLSGATPLELRHNTFAVVRGQVGAVSASAVIDTAARHSMGNHALRDALGFSPHDPRLRAAPTQTGGATGHTIETTVATVDVSLAGVGANALDMHFAAAPVFNALGLSDAPAFIAGGDLFHQWRSITIDYPQRQFAVQR